MGGEIQGVKTGKKKMREIQQREGKKERPLLL